MELSKGVVKVDEALPVVCRSGLAGFLLHLDAWNNTNGNR
jgi:hypothetical protein